MAFDPQSARATVTSVTFDPKKMTCASSGLEGNRVVQLTSPYKRVEARGNFEIACKRTPLRQGTLTVYPPATFTLGINSKPYAIRLPNDGVLDYADANQVRLRAQEDAQQLRTLRSEAQALQAQVTGLTAQVNRLQGRTAEVHLVRVGQLPAPAPWESVLIARGTFGYPSEQAYRDAMLRDHMEKICGTGAQVTAERWLPQLTHSGGCCGYQYYVYGCLREP